MKACIIVSLFLLVGCISRKNVQNIDFDLTAEQKEILHTTCSEISHTGDMIELLQAISQKQAKIHDLLSTPNPYHHEREIYQLIDEIRGDATKIEALATPDWTSPHFPIHYEWKFWRNDFRPNIGTYFPNGFSLIDYNVEEVILVGEKRGDLRDNLEFHQQGDSFAVTFSHEASSLTACQLASTLNILIKVKFRSVRTIKYRWFNLTVSKEALSKR